MVLAIEPMVNEGPRGPHPGRPWTVVTLDRGGSAHFEHTVAIAADGPRILTGAGAEGDGGPLIWCSANIG